ncbi:hypothetical protein JXA70_04175 [candidate division KSB1 bacterium]|nr:hypothetical protein [candidate division KSB1 bacterium]
MLSTTEEFVSWMQHEVHPQLIELLKTTETDILDVWRNIYAKYSDFRGDYSMLNLSGKLGKAVPEFMQLARRLPALDSGQKRKFFVSENILCLYRLIDGGETGTEKNIATAAAAAGMPIFVEDTDFEEQFVRPLAEQAIEQSYSVWKSVGVV